MNNEKLILEHYRKQAEDCGDKSSSTMPDDIIRKKELDLEVYGESGEINALLSELLAEFKDPKTELNIKVSLEYYTLAINLLDKINIDYPIPYIATTDEPLPICGVAICGTAVTPKGIWSLYIPTSKYFKVLSKEYNTKSLEVTFKLREV